MPTEPRLATLAALWSVWAEHGRTLTESQWTRPTRLEGWDVRSLVTHAAFWPHGFAALLPQIRADEPTHASATALLRDLNRPDGLARLQAAKVAETAREATFTPEQLTAAFAEVGPAALATADSMADTVIDYFGIARLRVREAVGIGIVEATVHLLDLQRALGREPTVPDRALRETAAILAAMPSPIAFIEAATGRNATPLFPILS